MGPLVRVVMAGLGSQMAHAQGLIALPDMVDRVAPSFVTVATAGTKDSPDEGASLQQLGASAVVADALGRMLESQGKSTETKKEQTDAALLEAMRKIFESQEKAVGDAAGCQVPVLTLIPLQRDENWPIVRSRHVCR